jgi:hypothetical protein
MNTSRKERVISEDLVIFSNAICDDCKSVIEAGNMARKITTGAFTGAVFAWYHLPLCPRDIRATSANPVS